MKSLINLPSIALLCYLGRVVYLGASIGDALCLFSLSALYAGWIYHDAQRAIPVNKAILDRLVDLEEASKVTNTKIDGLKLTSIRKF